MDFALARNGTNVPRFNYAARLARAFVRVRPAVSWTVARGALHRVRS
jgi:hypothetical protein